MDAVRTHIGAALQEACFAVHKRHGASAATILGAKLRTQGRMASQCVLQHKSLIHQIATKEQGAGQVTPNSSAGQLVCIAAQSTYTSDCSIRAGRSANSPTFLCRRQRDGIKGIWQPAYTSSIPKNRNGLP